MIRVLETFERAPRGGRSVVNAYAVSAPATPGAAPSTQPAQSLRDARRIANAFRYRGDITYQDVRIEKPDGRLVEYAGPTR